MWPKGELLSVREAARGSGGNPETIRRWIWSGKLGAQYLALASMLGIELWTGDQRLYNASRQAGLSWVHSVDEVVL